MSAVPPTEAGRARVLLLGRREPGRLDAVSGLLAALRRLGHPTVHLDDGQVPGTDPATLAPLVRRFRPHLLVRVGPDPTLPTATLEMLHSHDALALGWRVGAGAAGGLSGLDLLASAVPDPAPGVLPLPPAVDSGVLEQPLPAAPGPVRDVALVGHATGRRDWHALARGLVPRFAAVTVGAGWPRGWAGDPDGARLVQLLRHARVHVHLAPGPGPFLSVAAGGVLVAPRTGEAGDQLRAVFAPDAEWVPLPEPSAAVDVLTALLADPHRVAAVRAAASQRLRREHLYEHRWAALLAEVTARAAVGAQLPDPGLARQVLARAADEPPVRVRRVVVSGWYGAGNAGDELILESLATRIEADVPGAQVVVAARHPAAVVATHGLEAFSRLEAGAAEEEASRASAVLLGGGGLWEDYTFGQNGGVAGLVTGASASPSALAVLPLLSRVHRRPVHVVGMGVGPLTDPGARAVVGLVGGLSESVTVRDPGSRDLLMAIPGWEAPVEVAPDTVYALEPGPLHPPRVPRRDGRPLLAVNLRSWGEDEQGLGDAVTAALRHVVAGRGAQLVGVPFEPKDAARLRAVLGACDRDAVVLDPTTDLAQLLADLAACDALCSMRLHGCLLGHRAGVPVVGLGYDPKVGAHFAELDRQRYVVPLADAPARLPGLLEDVLTHGLPGDARQRVRALEAAAGGALRRLTTRLAATEPAAEPHRPLPWLDDAVPGRLTLPLAAADVRGRSTLRSSRVPPVRAAPVHATTRGPDLVLGLSESAPRAGDAATWSATVPAAGGGNGRRVRLGLHSPYREDPARTGRLAWQVLVDGRVLLSEDVAGWSEPVTAWLGWGAAAEDVRLEVRVLALRDCEDWRWGRAAGLRLEPPQVSSWTAGAPLEAGRWVASCSSPGAAVLA